MRGLAALVVVLCHVHAAFYREVPGFGFSDTVDWVVDPVHTPLFGEFAVYLFFVLSGFVLSVGYFQTFDLVKVTHLALKRLPRLVIPVFLTSLLYWLAVHFGWFAHQRVIDITHSTWLGQFWQETYSFGQFLMGVTYDLFVLNDQSFCLHINSCLWTMPIEFYYSYALFLALFMIRGKKTLAVYGLLLALSGFVPDQRCYFLAFGLGLNLAYAYVYSGLRFTNELSIGFLTMGVVLATNIFGRFWGNEIFFCLAASAMLAAVLFHPGWSSYVQQQVLVFVGKISFSLYLIHLLVLGTVSSWLFAEMHQAGRPYEAVYTTVFVATFALSIAAAYLIHIAIEKPSLRWAAAFADWSMHRWATHPSRIR